MLCQLCQAAEATVYYIETFNHQSKSWRLCESCAQKKAAGDLLGKPAQAIHEMLASILQLGAAQEDSAPDLECAGCGMHYSQFREIGRFGCAKCYTAFRERILPLIRQFHQAEEHRPRLAQAGGAPGQDQVKELREQITQAVSKDDFELAAKLRDQIRRLEEEKP